MFSSQTQNIVVAQIAKKVNGSKSYKRTPLEHQGVPCNYQGPRSTMFSGTSRSLELVAAVACGAEHDNHSHRSDTKVGYASSKV